MSALPRQGCGGAFAALYEIEHDVEGRTELEVHAGKSGRRVLLDGERVSRMGDFIGRFPVVPLSSGDLMLLRGSPAERRRFVDLTLSAIDPEYYHALRNYHRGVVERNRLLKQGGSAAELSAFEAEIAPYAVAVSSRRSVGMQRLREVLVAVYANIAESEEGPELEFKVNSVCEDVESVSRMLHASRQRDEMMGSTQKGPHRDDFNLSLSIGGAKEYASDGQQRGLCVALRIAQARIFQERLGVAPVLLADDVLGELDPHRKAGFWRACPPELQIIATGTELPEASAEWAIWSVAQGQFARQP
jgi:DNA replication and repair protein RecF